MSLKGWIHSGGGVVVVKVDLEVVNGGGFEL